MIHITKEKYNDMKKDLYGDSLKKIDFLKSSSEFKKKLKEKKRNARKIYEKENRKILKQKRKDRLKLFASELNDCLPKSEIWFWNKYQNYKNNNDIKNKPFGSFIFDVLNTKYKYSIEIDGSYHTLKKQIIRDAKKDKFIKKHGFSMIRIIAYNDDSFNEGITKILSIRNNYENKLSKYCYKGLVL